MTSVGAWGGILTDPITKKQSLGSNPQGWGWGTQATKLKSSQGDESRGSDALAAL